MDDAGRGLVGDGLVGRRGRGVEICDGGGGDLEDRGDGLGADDAVERLERVRAGQDLGHLRFGERVHGGQDLLLGGHVLDRAHQGLDLERWLLGLASRRADDRDDVMRRLRLLRGEPHHRFEELKPEARQIVDTRRVHAGGRLRMLRGRAIPHGFEEQRSNLDCIGGH